MGRVNQHGALGSVLGSYKSSTGGSGVEFATAPASLDKRKQMLLVDNWDILAPSNTAPLDKV